MAVDADPLKDSLFLMTPKQLCKCSLWLKELNEVLMKANRIIVFNNMQNTYLINPLTFGHSLFKYAKDLQLLCKL